jgi:hypothetical protein
LERQHTFNAINALHPELRGIYQRTVTEWDSVITRKNNRQAVLAVVATLLALTSLEVGWSGNEWVDNRATDILQIIISCLTGLHLFAVYVRIRRLSLF